VGTVYLGLPLTYPNDNSKMNGVTLIAIQLRGQVLVIESTESKNPNPLQVSVQYPFNGIRQGAEGFGVLAERSEGSGVRQSRSGPGSPTRPSSFLTVPPNLTLPHGTGIFRP